MLKNFVRVNTGILAVLLTITGVAGCKSVVQCCTGCFLGRSMTPADLTFIEDAEPAPGRTGDLTPAVPPADEPVPDAPGSNDREQPSSQLETSPVPLKEASLQADVSEFLPTESADNHQQQASDGKRQFNIPPELPGADSAPLRMPPLDAGMSADDRRSLVASMFPDVAEVQKSVAPGEGERVTLAWLQQTGLENSPVIRQAAADVEQARGQAIQLGLYPNPTVGYEGDTIGTGRTAGYNGLFFSQEFVTADKLVLARNSAMMEMQATEAELRKARVTLATNIRQGYFQALVAQEKVVFSRAIARLSDEVFQAQIDLVSAGEAAAYEPLQLRVFAVQSRNNVIQAQNELEAAWRRLAAAIGMPHLPRRSVAGSVQLRIPAVDYDQAAAVMLARHTDLAAARWRISGANCNLRLQQVTPIPNVTLYAAFQHDDTTPLSDYSTNVQLSVPVPLFDRNQGNIASAHGQLVRANNDLTDQQNKLMSRLAEIHARRSSAVVIAESYRTDLLPDQVRVYRGVYDRYRLNGESADFSQLVIAQQTLSQAVTSYLDALSQLWNATVDMAEVLQVDDIVTMDGLATGTSEQPVP
ncbi:MAG: TolC family protein [Planctomycetaceae bacterium]